jgi:hypothetical protein
VKRQKLNWDNVLALNYVAEQLCMAAQLLTSDTVPVAEGVRQACDRHLRSLLEHDGMLPSYVRTWIRECVSDCEQLCSSHSVEVRAAQRLAGKILQLLLELRSVLNGLSSQSGPALQAA